MAPRELAGLLWDCPKCGAAIRVEDDTPGGVVGRRAASRRGGRGLSARSWWAAPSTALKIATAVAGVAGIVVGAVVYLKNHSGVTPANRGAPLTTLGRDSWTNQDLANYLRSKGVDIADVQGVNPWDGRPVSDFRSSRGGRVRVIQCSSADSARESAGSDASGFSWGRFTFSTSDQTFGMQIRSALDAINKHGHSP